MSNTNLEDNRANTPNPPVPPTSDNQTPPAPQGDPETNWKEHARKWESRAKADEDAAKKWREYEASTKSEHEKLADELAREKAEAANARAELLRLKIAAEHGITGDALELLYGSTQEELESRAEKLKSLIGDQPKKPSIQPDPNQGKPAGSPQGQLTRDDLLTMSPDEVNRARVEGRLNEVLGIK